MRFFLNNIYIYTHKYDSAVLFFIRYYAIRKEVSPKRAHNAKYEN